MYHPSVQRHRSDGVEAFHYFRFTVCVMSPAAKIDKDVGDMMQYINSVTCILHQRKISRTFSSVTVLTALLSCMVHHHS